MQSHQLQVVGFIAWVRRQRAVKLQNKSPSYDEHYFAISRFVDPCSLDSRSALQSFILAGYIPILL